jgi:ABC-type sugar transport system permease subunit
MRVEKKSTPYLLIAPFFLLYFIFQLFPVLFSFYVSLSRWSGAGDPQFAGLSNYVRMFRDPVFYKSILNTFLIMIVALPLQLGFGLFLAVVLKDFTNKLRTPLQTLNFLPYLTTPVAIGLLFSLLFEWKSGTVNLLLAALGLVKTPYYWLGQEFGSRAVVIILCVWKYFGYMMVMFLAGLSTIPEELYEAARIDGAGWFQSFMRITIPMLRPIMTFVTTMSIIGGWKLFDEPKLLFPDASQPIGGPGRAVLTVVLKFYDTSFRTFDFGYGASIAYGLFIIIFVFSFVIIRIMNREEI